MQVVRWQHARHPLESSGDVIDPLYILCKLFVVSLTETMAYVIHQVNGLPTEGKGQLRDSVSYPSHDLPDKILTKITLWEVEENVGGMLTWSYWRSVFNRRPDYNIIVHQNDPIKNKTYTFVVHECDTLDVSEVAFRSVQSTLEPLVDDCNVILTAHLLEGIVIPHPRKPEELSDVLTELMQTNPNAHPNWVTVLRALWRQAPDQDNVDGLEVLVESAHRQDDQGNTFLHDAVAAGSIKCVQNITENTSAEDKEKLMKTMNNEGKAAVHCAFEQNNPDIARHLVQSGADLAMIANDKDGSNPFHLAALNDSARCIQATRHRRRVSAIEKNTLLGALDAPNKTGFTPLMFSVKGGFVDSTVSLLQAEANPNVQHLESGNTALHFAAENGNAVIVKALIAFGADVAIKNTEGSTPLDTALKATQGDAQTCVDVLKEITELTKEAKNTYSITPRVPNIDPDSVFLLCLDGGGVRGLLSLQILIAIRNRMKQIQPDCAPLQDYFDYLAGTSIGGLIALASSALNASLEESRDDLFNVVDDVFTTKPTFTFEAADGIAKSTFGLEMKISEITKQRIIVHTVEGDVNPPILHKICNFGKNKSEWKVWEAARATTAAPIYFPPHNEKYLDGGVMANNPTLSAMAKIVEVAAEEDGKQVKFGLVLSIGTGYGDPSHVEHVGVYVPSIFKLCAIPETFCALGNVMNLFIGQSTSSDGEVVMQARTWCTSVGAQYFRLSPLLSTPIDLAESKKEPIVQMLYEGIVYGLKSAQDIDMIARILLSRK